MKDNELRKKVDLLVKGLEKLGVSVYPTTECVYYFENNNPLYSDVTRIGREMDRLFSSVREIKDRLDALEYAAEMSKMQTGSA